jgi:hypothetical protein
MRFDCVNVNLLSKIMPNVDIIYIRPKDEWWWLIVGKRRLCFLEFAAIVFVNLHTGPTVPFSGCSSKIRFCISTINSQQFLSSTISYILEG